MEPRLIIFAVGFLALSSVALAMAVKALRKEQVTQAGQNVIASQACNLRIGSDAGVIVGRLSLTADALIWEPSGFPFPPGYARVTIPLSVVAGCSIQRDEGHLRRPLTIRTKDDYVYRLYFGDWLVGRPRVQEKWIRLIRQGRAPIG